MNRNKLFVISCVALITTAIAFSVRGDILDALGTDFHLSHEQLGVLLSPAFWGQTIAILVGGSLVDFLGMRRLLRISSFGYTIAPLAIIFAPRPAAPVYPYYSDPGFMVLYAGMLMLGLSQGLVEGAINPLVATVYSDDKTHRFNVLHAWWPGGLITGGLLVYGITKMMRLDQTGTAAATGTVGWQIKIALVMVPAAAYGLLTIGQKFSKTERVESGVSSRAMFAEILRPMFILMFVCMCMTASTELGPDQWVGTLTTNLTGMRGILILVYTAGIMFLLRFFVGGRLARRLSPLGLLTVSAALSAIRIVQLGNRQNPHPGFSCGDRLRSWQDVFLADDAGRDVGTIPARRRSPARDHGRLREPGGRLHPAPDGWMVLMARP
jgi:MFS family permease